MATITLRVLEGLERGETYQYASTPLTIGREEENHVRLNDERISRYHVKIQESDGQVILTDLQSTNGTRVNGYPVHMHVLVPGDQINIGRCILVYGTQDEIEAIVPDDCDADSSADIDVEKTVSSAMLPENAGVEAQDDDGFGVLFPRTTPPLPGALTGAQVAQLSDLLSFLHSRLGQIVESARAENEIDFELQTGAASPDGDDTSQLEELKPSPVGRTNLTFEAWQQLLDVELQLARYIREISNPDG